MEQGRLFNFSPEARRILLDAQREFQSVLRTVLRIHGCDLQGIEVLPDFSGAILRLDSDATNSNGDQPGI